MNNYHYDHHQKKDFDQNVIYQCKKIIKARIDMIIVMRRFFETETASICLDFTECGPCYESASWV